MRALAVVLAACALCACASASKRPVDAVSASDAAQLASEIASYVAGELPPASSTVSVAPVLVGPSSTSENLSAALASSLRDRGFAVFDGAEAGAVGHRLEASADAFDDGYIVRLTVEGSVVTRLYSRTADGALQAASAYAKRSLP